MNSRAVRSLSLVVPAALSVGVLAQVPSGTVVPVSPAVPAAPAVPAQPLQPLQQDPKPAAPDGAAPQQPQPDAAAAAAAKAVAEAKAAANVRLQKWKQLTFDRRPSSVLAAWAAPELKPYDPSEEKPADPAQAAGAAPPPPPPPPSAPAADGPDMVLIEGGEVVELLEAGGVVLQPGSPVVAGAEPGSAPAATPAANKEKETAEKKLQRELQMVQRAVMLDRWPAVAAFLQTLDEKARKDAYEHFLRAVLNAPPEQNQKVPPNLAEKNRFAFEDVLVLAGLAPGGFDKKQVPMLAPLVQRALEYGAVLEELLRLLEAETKKPAAEQRIDRREAAILLATIAQEAEVGPFLPTAADAEAANDREGLNLLARHALATYAKDKRTVHLETAWKVTQAVLAKGEVEDAVKVEALRRAVELAPKVDAALGPAWLADSFTNRPERGMEIVATIGGQVAKGFQDRPQDTAYRATGLRLQKTAVDALLKGAPALAEQWRPTLGILAAGWIVEASYSYTNSQSDSFGPVMQRDEFGNIFWSNMRRGGGGQVQAVEPSDLLEAQPGPAWAKLLGDALLPHFHAVSAQLFLKVNEPEKAFPFIEDLAKVNPRKAKDLAQEFLRVWIRNNNPNANTRTNSYMFMYGFEERSNGIPLTRSKQERNLAELGSWVERLRQLPIGGVDEKLLGEAFVAAHSKAEVYRMETIEKVFGNVAEMDPVLLGTMLGTMRTNLATVWRRPDVQEKAKTKRSQRETLQEVARGYETALQVAQRALQARGPHWALLSVVAAILHDQNNFARELGGNSQFADARKAAFELFAQGARHYVEHAGELRLDQETTAAFDTWFYAALGASDLGAVSEDTVVAKSQMPLIRAAIDELPEPGRDRHLAMFANALFTRMSAVKPQIKYRYLENGFAIVGDHPQAAEAKKVWDYYADLIRELHLEAVVEGPTAVGTEPFGVRIDIRHSPEIERESGGFAKYVQNQNNMSYAWNYGRPLEDYRDRFTDAATAALKENFEVLSVTFNSETMTSKPTDVPGWRRTPYAWLLLKARGPQIDKIPVVQIDFDFLDTSGYAVLPIASSPVAIDASSKAQRPFRDLQVTQLLDERRADEGKVTLEIKASCRGLVPELDAILALEAPGFVVKTSADQGSSVVKFTEDQDSVQSERTWLVSLVPEHADDRPRTFVFGKPKAEGMQVVYQRYDDADLQTVSAEVALSGNFDRGHPWWIWVLLAGATIGYAVWFTLSRPGRGAARSAVAALQMPQRVTPFTVLALLDEVRRRGRLDDDTKRQLEAAIARIEACHFGRAEDPTLDLAAVAAEWVRRAG
ncbi:MAG: hypothetical protein JNK78_19080 [Planctomycetes bacterium]|nr:hypothetical protein [Planctomycetota bacterium]